MLTPTTSLTTDHSSFDLQTIVQIMDQFLRSKKSSQTQRAYQQDIMSYFQQMQIVTVADLKRYTVYQLSDSILQYCDSFKKTDPYRTDRVLNPRTVNRKAYALSSFFEYLMAHFGYPRNPVKVFAPYTTPKTTSTDDLSQQEFDALRQYCQDLLIPIKPSEKKTDAKKTLHHYQQALIMTMLMMSLRRNEVANLRRDDRNQRNHVLTVYGKGQKEKYLPLPSLLIAQLATFSQFKTQYGIDSPYIFSALQNNSTHDTQKPISGSYIFQLVRKITHLLQISGQIDPDKTITPHSFRTTFVKFALEKKYTDIEIMNATGHATSAMIKYYDSRSPIDANAAKMMDGMFGRNGEG